MLLKYFKTFYESGSIVKHPKTFERVRGFFFCYGQIENNICHYLNFLSDESRIQILIRNYFS
uniref:Uncharacterized protein n=1 Tax=Octopus bimaculoides TaxID=37653 RepID=A0A0L8IBY7_OCTBM